MHGLYLLWWVQEKGLPAPLVALVLAAGDLVLLAVEMPTGWLADRLGHRLSLVAGSFAQVLGMLACWLGNSAPDLIAASVLVALGDALRSGADEALLYRTCQALGCEDAFQRLEARTHAVQQIALVGFVLLGGVMVERWGFAAGWIAETVLCGCGLVLALAMREPPAPAPALVQNAARRIPFFSPALVLMIVPAAVLGGVAGAGSFMAQTTGHGDAQEMTLLVAALTLAEAAGAAVATRVPASSLRTQLGLLGGGLAVSAVAIAVPSAFVASLIIVSFAAGLAEPLRSAAIQRQAADDVRARVASFASACDMACSLIVLPVAGFYRRRS